MVQFHVTRNLSDNGKISKIHLVSPRANGPDVCIDLTPEQAESLARLILIKLGASIK